MTQPADLNLSISADELTRFCNKLLKRSRDINKTHDALSTLEAFLTAFSRTSNHPDSYQTIENILHTFTERTRQALLTEKTIILTTALEQLDLVKLTSVHNCLSRNGFYQILATATAQLSDEKRLTLRSWCESWVNNAKHLAEQASGYPEAYDLNKAGIDINEFQAMQDVSHFINSAA